MIGRHDGHQSLDAAEDVESYTHARWNDLVRTLVALGADVPEAELAARAALVRCWHAWKEEHRSGDVDVLVYGALLRAWGWPREHPAVGADDVARTLVAEGRLSDYAAERVTGADPGAMPLREWQPEDRDDAYRGAAPLASIRDDLRRRRRRTTTFVAAAAAVTAVVAGLVLLLGEEPTPPDPPPVVVNPLPLAWWSQDTLHLARGEVTVPGLTALAQAGQGASYPVVIGDDRGRVSQVGDDLEPVQIGTYELGATIRASLDGLATWVDVSDPIPSVVVWDTEAREVVDRLPLTDSRTGLQTQVVALDGDTVYLRSPAGTSRWVLGEAEARPIRDRVLDAANGVLLVAMPPASTGSSILPGPQRFGVGADRQATLSPGGLIVAAWVPQEPDLILGGSGANLAAVPLRLPERSRILEARFAPNGDLVLVTSRVYLLARSYDDDGVTSSGRTPFVDLVTCDLQTGSCDVVVGRGAFASPSADESPVILAD